jgi:16S rRNA (uracil1498-N3)-methyltransferase
MAIHDFNAQRLYLDVPLGEGARVVCTSEQANYLLAVLRLGAADTVLVFNGRDGEWRASLAPQGKRGLALDIAQRTREQVPGPDIVYVFAPLKRARLDYMVQKAAEMGVARLIPVITRRTIAERVNLERMRANVIEAAEQCGILRVPAIDEPVTLERVLSRWDGNRRLVFCDEAATEADPIAALKAAFRGSPPPVVEDTPASAKDTRAPQARGPAAAVLVGPEGGFDPAERCAILAQSYTVPIRLGPRIMRADTAAIAALALVNAVVGDWR